MMKEYLLDLFKIFLFFLKEIRKNYYYIILFIFNIPLTIFVSELIHSKYMFSIKFLFLIMFSAPLSLVWYKVIVIDREDKVKNLLFCIIFQIFISTIGYLLFFPNQSVNHN